jgi:tetratricopeptide (TPR) repeat protein
LLSSISGSDKCTYAIFQDNTKAFDFVGSENVEKACLYQKKPVSKDAKVVSLSKNTCLDDEATVVWFVFKNENWLLNEKIILEIVPWVDYQARKGWTTAAKNNASTWVTNYAKTAVGNQYRGASSNFLKNLYQEFEADQFESFSEYQKIAVFEKYNEQFKSKLEVNRNYYKEAYDLSKKGNLAEAISVLESKIASKPSLVAQEWNLLGELYLKTNQIEKAFITLKNASTLYPESLVLKLNLAHAYMFKDEVASAKKIHKQFMTQNISAKQSWKNKAINDLDTFKKLDVPQKNIDKIWRLYN